MCDRLKYPEIIFREPSLCWAYLWQGEHDKAIDEGRLAIELGPDDVVALERLALCMIFVGDAEASLPLIDKARRLNPNQSYEFSRGVAMFVMSNYAESIELLQSDFESNPNFIPSALYLAASHALAGNDTEAKATVTRIKQINPNYRIATEFRTQFKNPENRERFVDGLRQAGLV